MLLAVVIMPSVFSQTANFVLRNDSWDGHKVYSVDLYIQSTNVDPLELAALTVGFQIPKAQLNGGTITAYINPASSSLVASQIPASNPNAAGTSLVGGITYQLIKIAAKTPPGAGNGSMLTTVAPGTRAYTLRLTNSVDWIITGSNVIDLAATGYPSALNCYIGGINTNIIAGVTVVKNLAGPLLPVELSSFTSTAQGRSVVLSWSTKSEKNSDRFDIQRSLVTNGTWSTVSSVKAAGLSNSTINYSYTDTKLQSGKYQYRINMIDNNGASAYSSVEAAEVAVPKDFAVSQNYPNPFNPSTKIDYQVPVDAKVILEVYNIAGQKVVELVNQEQSAGYYTVDFGSTRLSSGVYIYRLAASDKATGNNFSSIKKMMLLK
jgi:hypothetical protein